MKNFTLLLLFITGVAFTSCKKDPDEKAADNIVGKWYQQSFTEKEYKNGTLVDEYSSSRPSETISYEFKSDGTGVDEDGDSFKYKISGSKISIDYMDHGSVDEQIIKKITSSELILNSEESWESGSDVIKSIWEANYKKK